MGIRGSKNSRVQTDCKLLKKYNRQDYIKKISNRNFISDKAVHQEEDLEPPLSPRQVRPEKWQLSKPSQFPQQKEVEPIDVYSVVSKLNSHKKLKPSIGCTFPLHYPKSNSVTHATEDSELLDIFGTYEKFRATPKTQRIKISSAKKPVKFRFDKGVNRLKRVNVKLEPKGALAFK